MRPTSHLRFVVRYPARQGIAYKVLQQWWTTSEYIPIEGAPDGCIGEWRDIELVQE